MFLHAIFCDLESDSNGANMDDFDLVKALHFDDSSAGRAHSGNYGKTLQSRKCIWLRSELMQFTGDPDGIC